MKDTFSLNKLFSFIEQFYYFVTANNSKVSFIFWGHNCTPKNREEKSTYYITGGGGVNLK